MQARSRGYGYRSAVFSGVVGSAALIALPVAALSHGCMGVAALGLAVAVCYLPALLSLWLTCQAKNPQVMLGALLIGIVLRMSLPILCALILHTKGGPLTQAGGIGYLLVFYPVTLLVETVLSLPRTDEVS